jgi:hypothetical protein
MSDPKTRFGSFVFGLFLLLIFSLGFMRPSVDAGRALLTPTDLIFPAVFTCWLIAIAFGAIRITWRSEFLAFGAYFVALFVSAVFSVAPRLSFVRLAGAAYLMLLAVLSSSLITNVDRLRFTTLAWLSGSVLPLIASLIAILFFYFVPESSLLPDLTYHYGAVPVGNFPRISSTFISASMFCNYLTVTLILALLSVRMRWIRTSVALPIIIAIGISALFTVSIALGGVALAAGLWLWLTNRGSRTSQIYLLLGGALALAFLVIAPFELSLPAGSSFLGGLTPSSRFLVWRDTFQTIVSRPLTGNGIGTAVAGVAYQNSDGTWSMLTDAHNSFLSVLGQTGILGLAAITAIVVVTMKAGSKRSGDEELDYVRRCLLIAFFAAFVYDGLTGSFEDARHLWVLIGLILAAKNMQRKTDGSISLNSA